MTKKENGNIWRVAALIVLCGLVYYFSYAQGRDSARADLDGQRREASATLEAQRQEIARLRQALNTCAGELAPPEAAKENADRPQPAARLKLREKQSEMLFDGQIIVSLLQVADTENRALLQLNFLQEGRMVTESLGAGGSLKFDADGRTWVLVVNTLSTSSVVLNLVELKP